MMTRNRLRWLLVGLTLFAFGLRLWRLDSVPPGWRDDELINSLVISQKVIDGDWAVYYPDASGHEALYHALNAFMLWVFGANIIGIRLLSVFLGTLTVPATYVLGRRLFGWRVGVIAAAGLSVSFWALMYSRIGLRHVLMPLLTVLAFAAFWRGFAKLKIEDSRLKFGFNHQSSLFALAALFVGLGFYTYFASRGVPLILAAFLGGVWLVDRARFWRQWRGWLLMFVLMGVLALPLVWTLGQQPESEARVAELAVPVIAAREGDLRPLWQFTTTTLGMFHATGDNEWLYNIPDRPVFGFVGAVFFWLGVALAAIRIPLAVFRKPTSGNGSRFTDDDFAHAFLLLWWLAGIAPGFISVPPASLGHTILAQPATFILVALPIQRLMIDDLGLKKSGFNLKSSIINLQSVIMWGAVLVLIGSIAARDWPAYFEEWPQRGMARFLYRAEVHEVAGFVNGRDDLTDFGVTGLLAGPWDRVALAIDLAQPTAVSPRWYNPTRAVVLRPSLSFTGYPDVEDAYAAIHESTGQRVGGYTLAQTTVALPDGERVCFENGLCWATADFNPETGLLELGWEVADTPGSELQLPPMPLISNPPPPGVYSGPRLAVFAQLLDADGNFVAGDDGLWVDPVTLRSGDQFLQQHWLVGVGETAVFGLYDPMTGERILTVDGRDYLELTIND